MAKKRSSLVLKRSRTITSGSQEVKKVTSLKPQRTRQLIRRFHILQKQKSNIFKILEQRWDVSVNEDNYISRVNKRKLLKAALEESKAAAIKSINLKSPPALSFQESDSDEYLVKVLGEIDAEVDKRGGLLTYQTASTLGQSRGGDSSKKLMEWLKLIPLTSTEKKPNALEIGCLSSQNLISTSNYFANVTRIDLRSQEKGLIIEQDFMKRPLPASDAEKFNLISCSLVVNFVPTALERGEMMKRMTKFLKSPSDAEPIKPMLFFVLPLPCVSNSRYFDNDRLDRIMESLGFKKLHYYEAKKVAYWLWDWRGNVKKSIKFKKEELHSGAKRNNFCIVIE